MTEREALGEYDAECVVDSGGEASSAVKACEVDAGFGPDQLLRTACKVVLTVA